MSNGCVEVLSTESTISWVARRRIDYKQSIFFRRSPSREWIKISQKEKKTIFERRAELWDWGARRFVRRANVNLQRSQGPASGASNFWQNKLLYFQLKKYNFHVMEDY